MRQPVFSFLLHEPTDGGSILNLYYFSNDEDGDCLLGLRVFSPPSTQH